MFDASAHGTARPLHTMTLGSGRILLRVVSVYIAGVHLAPSVPAGIGRSARLTSAPLPPAGRPPLPASGLLRRLAVSRLTEGRYSPTELDEQVWLPLTLCGVSWDVMATAEHQNSLRREAAARTGTPVSPTEDDGPESCRACWLPKFGDERRTAIDVLAVARLLRGVPLPPASEGAA